MTNIGVLALQGSVIEHMRMLDKLEDVRGIEVKKKEQIDKIDGIIIPGGESTTISKLLSDFGLFWPLKERIQQGMPVWGTCAGMILLAKNIVGERAHLAVMDITVRRNAYGRQISSFGARALIPQISANEIPLVFIRAPWIESAGAGVEILCTLNTHIVAAREKNMLATAFHPELTSDLSVHSYFVKICKDKFSHIARR